jgi:pimeloyl-ACP methyl ester carboxylesterase
MLDTIETKAVSTPKARQARRVPMSNLDRKRILLDGPFTESKELWLGSGPARDDVGRYASVNGLRMYYEVHGRGRPLVLLHAALSNIESGFGKVVRALAATRKVIAIEQQAHGRTEDISRVLTYEQMADDTAELLRRIDIRQADFFGFSMGAAVALILAVRHPGVVRKLAVVAGGADPNGWEQAMLEQAFRMSPDAWPPEFKTAFLRGGVAPEQWPAAIRRMHQAFSTFRGLRRDQVRAIRAPTLIVGGEYGLVRRDHTHELARLVPKSRLEILSGDDHQPLMVERSATLVPGFLDA